MVFVWVSTTSQINTREKRSLKSTLARASLKSIELPLLFLSCGAEQHLLVMVTTMHLMGLELCIYVWHTAIKSSYCSYPQHLHGDLEHLQLQFQGIQGPLWPLWAPDMQAVHLQACKENTQTHKAKTNQPLRNALCTPRVPQCTCVSSGFSTPMAYPQLTILACIVFSIHDISPPFKRFMDAQPQYVLK